MDRKVEKLQSTILREGNVALQQKIKENKDFLSRINIVEAKMSKDKSYVKLYYTCLTDDNYNVEFYDNLLEKHSKKIRMIVAEKINLRSAPNLKFVYDKSIDNANNIERILDIIKNKN